MAMPYRTVLKIAMEIWAALTCWVAFCLLIAHEIATSLDT